MPLKGPEFPEIAGQNFCIIEKLFRIYGRYAFGVAVHYFPDSTIAEEITHMAFIKYWKEPNLHTLKGAAFFKWLLREVQQLCLQR